MSVTLVQACIPATFGSPSVFGTEILSLQASLVTNYSASVPDGYRFTLPSVEVENATFCKVTVSYTHPGADDNLIAEAWLPVDNWNGRFQAVGGGGWSAGRFYLSYVGMAGAMGDGYATITTDAGLGTSLEPSPWALLSPGHVDMHVLQDLGSVSLIDEAIIGKKLIKSFYGQGPRFSYWNGCSQGGRQGLALAQRYPTAYDGIAAGAPAIHWTELLSDIFWPQQYMSMTNTFPYGCEMDAITAAAVSTCDGLDGVVDGIVAQIDACLDTFDPFEMVGTTVNCAQAGGEIQITSGAAAVVNATWNGHVTVGGKQIWPGLNPGTDLTGNSPSSQGQPGLAATNCSSGTCIGAPNYLSTSWLKLFLAKNPNFDVSNVTHAEFDRLAHIGRQEFNSAIGTDDPDLSEFRNAGGKMVTFHGLADNIIPTKGTEQYYKAVTDLIPEIHDFYRYFEVPGLGHCFGGPSGPPTSLFEQLRAWVENGTAPETTPYQVTNLEGTQEDRVLCPYPQRPAFDDFCGDSGVVDCWTCEESTL